MANFNTNPITTICATICKMFTAVPPKTAEKPDDGLLNYVKNQIGDDKIDRAIIYNPDALAEWLTREYPNKFQKILRHAPHAQRMLSMIPPKTPVCFASMYSGALPEVHGIQKYEKVKLNIDTMFDSLIKAGKKVCIVTVQNQSMDVLFRDKAMDYYALENDISVTNKAVELIKAGIYDLICVYNQEYDDRMHRSHPRSKSSLLAIDHHADSFDKICETVDKYLGEHNTLVGCCTDHGVHREWYLLGQHGKNIPQDMNIIHWWGVKKKA